MADDRKEVSTVADAAVAAADAGSPAAAPAKVCVMNTSAAALQCALLTPLCASLQPVEAVPQPPPLRSGWSQIVKGKTVSESGTSTEPATTADKPSASHASTQREKAADKAGSSSSKGGEPPAASTKPSQAGDAAPGSNSKPAAAAKQTSGEGKPAEESSSSSKPAPAAAATDKAAPAAPAKEERAVSVCGQAVSCAPIRLSACPHMHCLRLPMQEAPAKPAKPAWKKVSHWHCTLQWATLHAGQYHNRTYISLHARHTAWQQVVLQAQCAGGCMHQAHICVLIKRTQHVLTVCSACCDSAVAS